MPFVKENQASRYYNVSTATIRKYAREKSIHTEKLASGQYRYWIEQHTNTEYNQSNEKLTVAYVRVSSYKQRYDLKHVRPDASSY